MSEPPPPKYHEQWFGPRKRKNFQAALDSWTPIPGDIIEVGCWEGRSTVMLANHVFPRPVHVIDHFGGGSASDNETTRAGSRSIEPQFRSNIKAWTEGNVSLYVTDWRPWFTAYPYVTSDPMEGRIAILHIDADHTYNEVRDNLLAAKPFLQPGTLVLGDDFTMTPVRKAVSEIFPDVEADTATWWYTIPA